MEHDRQFRGKSLDRSNVFSILREEGLFDGDELAKIYSCPEDYDEQLFQRLGENGSSLEIYIFFRTIVIELASYKFDSDSD